MFVMLLYTLMCSLLCITRAGAGHGAYAWVNPISAKTQLTELWLAGHAPVARHLTKVLGA